MLRQKLNELMCWILGTHILEGRLRFIDGRMEGYWWCYRCHKELGENGNTETPEGGRPA